MGQEWPEETRMYQRKLSGDDFALTIGGSATCGPQWFLMAITNKVVAWGLGAGRGVNSPYFHSLHQVVRRVVGGEGEENLPRPLREFGLKEVAEAIPPHLRKEVVIECRKALDRLEVDAEGRRFFNRHLAVEEEVYDLSSLLRFWGAFHDALQFLLPIPTETDDVEIIVRTSEEEEDGEGDADARN